MIHIHYTDGPEILSDISIEVSDSIIKSLQEKQISITEIAHDFEVSEGIVEEIEKICKDGLKRCCFCGAIFDPKGHSRRNKCYKFEHLLPCVDCGKPLKVKESYAEYMKAGGRRCPDCRAKQIGTTRKNKSQEEKDAIVAKQQATMIERYGAATPLQVPEMKAKIQATVKERYGVDNLSQSAEIQEKIRQHSQEKYGVDHYSNAPEIREKMHKGMLDKYGVEYAQQNKDIQERTKQTNLERYGVENVFQNREIRETFVRNHVDKYGVEWPHQRPDLIEQVRQSNTEKYGAPMYPVSDEYMRTVISDPTKFENYKAFMNDPEKFINDNYLDKPSVTQICDKIGVTDTTVYDKLISIGRRDLATEFCYTMETQVREFIHSLDSSINIQMHNRTILKGKEIDLYLPDYKIGIECNPTYTHNSSFNDPWGEPPKSYLYHSNKSTLAQQEDVFLFHIFGYEWTNNRAKIKSQIQNLIGSNTRKEYARSLHLEELTSGEATNFLNLNHRQGSAQGKVRIGLKSNKGELLSLMTFGKMRPGIGKKSDQSDNEWELIRFCNLSGTTVVGGASKLFKYFLKEYNPNKVVSFSDRAHTRGNLYQILGFNAVSISDPGYVWVNLKNDSYYTRVSCQKHNLIKLFEDVTQEDIQNKTEPEIMMEHGYARVFDSGVIRWVYDCTS